MSEFKAMAFASTAFTACNSLHNGACCTTPSYDMQRKRGPKEDQLDNVALSIPRHRPVPEGACSFGLDASILMFAASGFQVDTEVACRGHMSLQPE